MPDLLALLRDRLSGYTGTVILHVRDGELRKYTMEHDAADLLATATSAPGGLYRPHRDLAPATRTTAPVPQGAGRGKET